MEMFLMVGAMSLMGVAVSAILFAAATREQGPVPPQRPAERPQAVPSRFFAENASIPDAVGGEELLLRIEHHIRLEQAAAEAFLHAPTSESLHSRTRSPLSH